MSGEKNPNVLLQSMNPKQNMGEFVVCKVGSICDLNLSEVVMTFREEKGITIIVEGEVADRLQLHYSFIASWITLCVHSSLEAVGFTAAFSKALADSDISCNVVAAIDDDHIFVDQKDAEKALLVLKNLS